MADTPQIARADYRHFMVIPTRWIDNDIYGHVNNAIYYAFFDTVINHYLVTEGGMDMHSGDTIGLAVETHCQFMAPIAFPDVIDAGLRVAKLGRSSVRYEVGIFRQQDTYAAAQGYFIHVFVNRETRRPAPLPDTMRAALARLLTEGAGS